jgi:hypothetical protein
MTKKYGGKTTEQFKEEVKNILGEDYEILEEYKNNKTPILVMHKTCGNKYKVTPQNLLKGSKCNHCNIKSRTKTTEYFIKEVYDLVGDEYTVLGEYAGNKRHILLRHNTCGTEYQVTPNSFLRGCRCKKCTVPNYDRDTEQYIKEVYEQTKGEYEVLGEYVNYNTKIHMKHVKCGAEWEVTPKRFLGKKTRCPHCAKFTKVKSHSDFLNEIFSLVGDEYTVLSEYERSNKRILLRHNDCGHEYMVTPNTFLNGCRCPECISPRNSKYAQKITNILDTNNIIYKKEYWFEDCRNVLFLYFDFGIIDMNGNLLCLLEVDGQQHFEPVRFYGESIEMATENFYETIKRDNIKNKYCKDNNIKLIRIPYWEFKNTENLLSILKNNSII